MKGKRNLEKAIVLGLLLSTSVYGTVWAEEYTGTMNKGITVNQGDNVTSTVSGDVNFELENDEWITNTGGNLTITGSGDNNSLTVTTKGDRILVSNQGINNIHVDGDISLTTNSTGKESYGLYNELGEISISSNSGDIQITADLNNINASIGYDVAAIYNANILGQDKIEKNNLIDIDAAGGVIIKGNTNTKNTQNAYGIYSKLSSWDIESTNNVETYINAGYINIESNSNRNYATAIFLVNEGIPPITTGEVKGDNLVKLTGTSSEYDNSIKGAGNGIRIQNNSNGLAQVELISENKSNVLDVSYDAISVGNGTVKLIANKYTGSNIILAGSENATSSGYGIQAFSGSNIDLSAGSNILTTTKNSIDSNEAYSGQTGNEINLTAYNGNNEMQVTSQEYAAIDSGAGSVITLTAFGNNIVSAHQSAIINRDEQTIKVKNSILNLTAYSNGNLENSGKNIVSAGENNNLAGVYDALYANGDTDNTQRGDIKLIADTANEIHGSVVAENKAQITLQSKNNIILSANEFEDDYYYAVRADGSENLTGENRTVINIISENNGKNLIYNSGVNNSKNERVVFATEGGVVNIEGTSEIYTEKWSENNEDGYKGNNTSNALIAGSYDWGNEKPDFNMADENRSEINFSYGNDSVVTGDIAAGYAGAIKITSQNSPVIATYTNDTESTAGNSLNINGNVLAANGGKVTLELGTGSIWNGRSDDYQDAANPDWGHDDVFAPVFSNGIEANGTVDVKLANGAIWNVLGQSWVTKLDGDGVINLAESNAVHIGEISGSNTFIINLDKNNLETSDMLYVKSSSGEQKIAINNRDEVLASMEVGDKIRFATVANASESLDEGSIVDVPVQTFGRSTAINDAGMYNVNFAVEYEDYNNGDNDTENDNSYNGENFSNEKPGTEYVDENYGNGPNAQNVYLVRKGVQEENLSDAGKTIINMSRANYKNAIYMDRLNKRLGEARYINSEEDQGMWVRLRHDRIGQSGDFRSMNTMYELGYDVKQNCDNGERRIGMAVDYMRGSTTYSDIMGKGETKRYGLWLYDTWLGDKGHYADYVLKWGHLSNDFDITAKSTLENITGDYSNNVFSVSAEYGKKNEMGSGWYFEPQAQLQLASVTGADYVSSQGTKVSVDGINSLIGRAGFRLGRDLNESSTVYLKADLLHEFLGDQTITAQDATGTLREEFENKGTWYDVGIGFAAQTGKNSYAFLDVEKSFGNDNDETYQINAGMQWTF